MSIDAFQKEECYHIMIYSTGGKQVTTGVKANGVDLTGGERPDQPDLTCNGKRDC